MDASSSFVATRKLAALMAMVVVGLATILFANRRLYEATTGLAKGGDEGRMWRGLQRLHALPREDKPAITLQPGTELERAMRHAEVQFLHHVKVLVLAQSDVDHITSDLFRNPADFFNGYISTAAFADRREFFDDMTRAYGAPELVLLNFGHEEFSNRPIEPPFDEVEKARHAQGRYLAPWYHDVDSLLSIQQTKLTVLTLWDDMFTPKEVELDLAKASGKELFSISSYAHAVDSWRNTQDGSRIFALEENTKLHHSGDAPCAPIKSINRAVVDRYASTLDRLRAAGSRVIAFTAAQAPGSFDCAPNAAAYMKELDEALAAEAASRGADYCGLSLKAADIGCTRGDYWDRWHNGRHCADRVVRYVANHCAKINGAYLRSLLKPEALAE